MAGPWTQYQQPGGAPKPAGLLTPGNVDLQHRPIVKNPDGSISTVRSLGVNIDGREVLIPTVAADGSGILSDTDAIAQYRKTGQHLGIFDTPEHSTAYAQTLHQQQAQQYAQPKPWERYARPADFGPTGAGELPSSPQEPGMLTRIWRGLSGEDSSKAGAVGMGMADPAVGAGQFAAHAGVVTPEAGMPEGMFAGAPGVMEPLVKPAEIDKVVQQREQRYEAGREGAGRLGADWMRLLGNVASPVNAIAAAPAAGGVGMAGRIAAGALGGGVGGALSPVASGDFARQKLTQAALGAAGGAVIAPAAKWIGDALSGRSPGEVANFISAKFNQAVRPPRGRIGTAPQMEHAREQALTAVRSIAGDPALEMSGAGGAKVTGGTPSSLQQFAEAIHGRMQKVFGTYDAMAQRAEGAVTDENAAVPKFIEGYEKASRGAWAANSEVADAERAVTQAAAKQSRAGDNVYSSATANRARQAAENRLANARIAQQRALAAQETAKQQMRGVWVDTAPIARELRAFAQQPMADFDESARTAARRFADDLEKRGAYSPLQAQNVIKGLNEKLETFYQRGAMGETGLARVNAIVADGLRHGMDEAVTRVEGPGYAALKSEYGALKSIEKSVVQAAMRHAAKQPGGGFLGNLADVATAEQFARAVLTMNPAPLAQGVALQMLKRFASRWRSPDHAVKQLFRAASRPATEAGPVRLAAGAAVRPLPGIAGAAAGEQARGPAMRYTVAPPPGP